MMTRIATLTALAAAGIVLAAAGFWAGKSLTTATITPTVQTGTVGLVGSDGEEFSVRLAGQSQLTGYALPSGVTWRDAYDVWQLTGRPGCMAPLSHGQRITFGVVNAAPVAGAPGGPVVVWLKCPSRPVPRYPVVTPPTAASRG